MDISTYINYICLSDISYQLYIDISVITLNVYQRVLRLPNDQNINLFISIPSPHVFVGWVHIFVGKDM